VGGKIMNEILYITDSFILPGQIKLVQALGFEKIRKISFPFLDDFVSQLAKQEIFPIQYPLIAIDTKPEIIEEILYQGFEVLNFSILPYPSKREKMKIFLFCNGAYRFRRIDNYIYPTWIPCPLLREEQEILYFQELKKKGGEIHG
jgi:hypothetical protein